MQGKEYYSGYHTYVLSCFKGKIIVPKEGQLPLIQWYHEYLCHPGERRTVPSLQWHFWWPRLEEKVRNEVKLCQVCQRTKRRNQKYGMIPIKEVESKHWNQLCVDLIGPYKIRRKNKTVLTCQTVTMIDPATSWFLMAEYKDKHTITISNIVEQEWLSSYPWPSQVVTDGGNEFMGKEFKEMLQDDYGIKMKYTTTRNPQVNSVVERVHQVIANMVRSFELQGYQLE